MSQIMSCFKVVISVCVADPGVMEVEAGGRSTPTAAPHLPPPDPVFGDLDWNDNTPVLQPLQTSDQMVNFITDIYSSQYQFTLFISTAEAVTQEQNTYFRKQI